MTLLVRDEADVVDAQLAFHLRAGVDHVIATDNASSDGTTEVLERYERAGHVTLIREPANDMRQAEWVTRMARLAATELDAGWVDLAFELPAAGGGEAELAVRVTPAEGSPDFVAAISL